MGVALYHGDIRQTMLLAESHDRSRRFILAPALAHHLGGMMSAPAILRKLLGLCHSHTQSRPQRN